MSFFDFLRKLRSNNFASTQSLDPRKEEPKHHAQILAESSKLINNSCDIRIVLKHYNMIYDSLNKLFLYTDEELRAAGFQSKELLSSSFSYITSNKTNIINQAIERNVDRTLKLHESQPKKLEAFQRLYDTICSLDGLDRNNIAFLNELRDKIIKPLQKSGSKSSHIVFNKTEQPINQAGFSVSIQYDGPEKPTVTVVTSEKEEYDLETEYVELSTSGDESVCPMCAQFEGKIFPSSDAPKLPLCPNCACAYIYYDNRNELPSGAVISKSSDFTLPSNCTPLFYKIQHVAYEEDIQEAIKVCERSMKKLPEFMAPYISAKFNVPELACRDLLPELYMRLGKWDKAEKTIKACISANTYYPEDGSFELSNLNSYRKVADAAVSYITQNPGCLQRNIYRKLPFEGDEKEQLKYFLRHSLQITKEKSGNTNKLFVKEQD